MCCPYCGETADGKPVRSVEDLTIPDLVGKYIEKLLDDKPKFHGSVKANFNAGGITNINMEESLRLDTIRELI